MLAPASVGAGVYAAWQRRLAAAVDSLAIPAAVRPHVRALPLSVAVEWLQHPPAELGPDAAATRDSLLLGALSAAVADLTERLGPEMAGWRYGQPAYRHALLRHPLGALVPDSLRRRLDVGPLPRGGDAHTVGAGGGVDNQTSGASFRIVVDVGDWDASLGTSTPGQSGDPRSPHYRDLFGPWARDTFFPVVFSRAAVERAAERRELLLPPG